MLKAAPQNLAAIRGLAEIHRRKGELREALDQYRTAFELAQNDPSIDQIVRDLRRELSPADGRPSPVPDVPGVAVRVPGAPAVGVAPARQGRDLDADRMRLKSTVAELERWLMAILEDRRNRLYTASS